MLDFMPFLKNQEDIVNENGDIDNFDAVWKHISDPFLVGVPKALKSVIFDHHHRKRFSSNNKSDNYTNSTRKKWSLGRITRLLSYGIQIICKHIFRIYVQKTEAKIYYYFGQNSQLKC